MSGRGGPSKLQELFRRLSESMKIAKIFRPRIGSTCNVFQAALKGSPDTAVIIKTSKVCATDCLSVILHHMKVHPVLIGSALFHACSGVFKDQTCKMRLQCSLTGSVETQAIHNFL
jgi:hypothetical protein